MADILIPDVPEDVIAAIDLKAQRLGLSRADYLLRVLTRERVLRPVEVNVADLTSLAETFADLDDPKVIVCEECGLVWHILPDDMTDEEFERKQFTYEPTLIADE